MSKDFGLLRFGDVLGQRAAVDLLQRALREGRLPHALLFQGPEDVGKAAVARTLAAALVCERNAEGEPCGTCAGCRRVAAGTHPDVLLVTRLPRKAGARRDGEEDDEEEGEAEETAPASSPRRGSPERKREILVEQIRELCEHAAYAPREGRRRVFLVDPADRMNRAAQNALLKTLEEPPGRALLVLITARAHLLLPTVRSRCLPVRFAPMPVRALAEALQRRGVAGDDALVRAALAGGAPGRALTGDTAALRTLRDTVLSAVEKAATGPTSLADLPGLVSAFAPKEDEDAFLERLDLAQALLRDAARAVAGEGGGDALLHADQAGRLRALGARLGRARLAALLPALERLRGDLRFYVNRTLLTEAVVAALAGGPIP
ncbi:MAG TPA: DNA polymerase III subunit delta' [Candidatus Polarisedimenticolaceae bacterium]|nr:DNA polymerase III subunit delta' [Candidatus Polarisedimenticolaceae bacterium]